MVGGKKRGKKPHGQPYQTPKSGPLNASTLPPSSSTSAPDEQENNEDDHDDFVDAADDADAMDVSEGAAGVVGEPTTGAASPSNSHESGVSSGHVAQRSTAHDTSASQQPNEPMQVAGPPKQPLPLSYAAAAGSTSASASASSFSSSSSAAAAAASAAVSAYGSNFVSQKYVDSGSRITKYCFAVTAPLASGYQLFLHFGSRAGEQFTAQQMQRVQGPADKQYFLWYTTVNLDAAVTTVEYLYALSVPSAEEQKGSWFFDWFRGGGNADAKAADSLPPPEARFSAHFNQFFQATNHKGDNLFLHQPVDLPAVIFTSDLRFWGGLRVGSANMNMPQDYLPRLFFFILDDAATSDMARLDWSERVLLAHDLIKHLEKHHNTTRDQVFRSLSAQADSHSVTAVKRTLIRMALVMLSMGTSKATEIPVSAKPALSRLTLQLFKLKSIVEDLREASSRLPINTPVFTAPHELLVAYILDENFKDHALSLGDVQSSVDLLRQLAVISRSPAERGMQFLMNKAAQVFDRNLVPYGSKQDYRQLLQVVYANDFISFFSRQLAAQLAVLMSFDLDSFIQAVAKDPPNELLTLLERKCKLILDKSIGSAALPHWTRVLEILPKADWLPHVVCTSLCRLVAQSALTFDREASQRLTELSGTLLHRLQPTPSSRRVLLESLARSQYEPVRVAFAAVAPLTTADDVTLATELWREWLRVGIRSSVAGSAAVESTARWLQIWCTMGNMTDQTLVEPRVAFMINQQPAILSALRTASPDLEAILRSTVFLDSMDSRATIGPVVLDRLADCLIQITAETPISALAALQGARLICGDSVHGFTSASNRQAQALTPLTIAGGHTFRVLTAFLNNRAGRRGSAATARASTSLFDATMSVEMYAIVNAAYRFCRSVSGVENEWLDFIACPLVTEFLTAAQQLRQELLSEVAQLSVARSLQRQSAVLACIALTELVTGEPGRQSAVPHETLVSLIQERIAIADDVRAELLRVVVLYDCLSPHVSEPARPALEMLRREAMASTETLETQPLVLFRDKAKVLAPHALYLTLAVDYEKWAASTLFRNQLQSGLQQAQPTQPKPDHPMESYETSSETATIDVLRVWMDATFVPAMAFAQKQVKPVTDPVSINKLRFEQAELLLQPLRNLNAAQRQNEFDVVCGIFGVADQARKSHVNCFRILRLREHKGCAHDIIHSCAAFVVGDTLLNDAAKAAQAAHPEAPALLRACAALDALVIDEQTLVNDVRPLQQAVMTELEASLPKASIPLVLSRVSVLARSRELVLFLREVGDNDLRNLLNAVDDHSENFVRTTNIQDFIQLQRQLRHLLAETEHARSLMEVLGPLLRAVVNSNDPQRPSLDAAIIDASFACVHSVRRMYSGLANRSLSTKTTILEIMASGSFVLEQNGATPGQFTFKALLTRNAAVQNSPAIDEAALDDLRGRALLLAPGLTTSSQPTSSDVNGDMQLLQSIRAFVDMVDTCHDALDAMGELFTLGAPMSHVRLPFHALTAVEMRTEVVQATRAVHTTWDRVWRHMLNMHPAMRFVHPRQLLPIEAFLRLAPAERGRIMQDQQSRQTQWTAAVAGVDDVLLGARAVLAMIDANEQTQLQLLERAKSPTLVLGSPAPAQTPDGQLVARMLVLADAVGALTADLLSVAATEQSSHHLPALPAHIIAALPARVTSGQAHLVLAANTHDVPAALLTLYLAHGTLPSHRAVFFCEQTTDWPSLVLFVHRALLPMDAAIENALPLFTLAFPERLPLHIQHGLMELLHDIVSRLKQSSERTGRQSDVRARLCLLSVDGAQSEPLQRAFEETNQKRLTALQARLLSEVLALTNANVTVITSSVPGMGKTERAMELAGGTATTISLAGAVEGSSLLRAMRKAVPLHDSAVHISVTDTDDAQALELLLFQLVVIKALQDPGSCTPIDVAFPLYVIELGSPGGLAHAQRQFHLLPLFKCEELSGDPLLVPGGTDAEFPFFISPNPCNPVRVVCAYLHLLHGGRIGEIELTFDKAMANTANNMAVHEAQRLDDRACKQLLRQYFYAAVGNKRYSYNVLYVFIRVLAAQLLHFSSSIFFGKDMLGQMLEDGAANAGTIRARVAEVRRALVENLVVLARSFAVKSVVLPAAAGSAGGADMKASLDRMVQQTMTRVTWDQSGACMIVFNSNDTNTITPIFRRSEDLGEAIDRLLKLQLPQQMREPLSLHELQPRVLLERLMRVVCTDADTQPKMDQFSKGGYVLSLDNFVKMSLIMTRINANVPVVLMGESGCGKTSLTQKLADIVGAQLTILSIHSGTTVEDVEAVLADVEAACALPSAPQQWLFLDEFNTSDAVGMIADLIGHRMKPNGQRVHHRLVFIAACNPYRERKLQPSAITGGLRLTANADDPMSRLVYRVRPIPDTLADYVWDYGVLPEHEEKEYILSMAMSALPAEFDRPRVAQLLQRAQAFVRSQQDAWSVSLRDVRRCLDLMLWFVRVAPAPAVANASQNTWRLMQRTENTTWRCVALALAVCYRSRLHEEQVRVNLMQDLNTQWPREARGLSEYVRTEEQAYIDAMDIEPSSGIAKNSALKEMVFVTLVCILNRIPLFVVDHPGTGKSLTMALINASCRGKDSKHPFLQSLPALAFVPYQGSSSSTSEGIVKIFAKARDVQRVLVKGSADLGLTVLAVVLLDEVGLAEISPHNPLKVLHALLEPAIGARPDVAVVGVSNWSLDPAKMSRAIHLSRPGLTTTDLVDTAHAIFRANAGVSTPEHQTQYYLQKSAGQYHNYITGAKHSGTDNFHGLRDYYGLIKSFAQMCRASVLAGDAVNQQKCFTMAVQRNFGGRRQLMAAREFYFDVFTDADTRFRQGVIQLIQQNLEDRNGRHLMLIASDLSGTALATRAVKLAHQNRATLSASVSAASGDTKDTAQPAHSSANLDAAFTDVSDDVDLMSTDRAGTHGGKASQGVVDQVVQPSAASDGWRQLPRIFYGSNFPDDDSDKYRYSILSEVIVCMETGRMVVFVGNHSIFSSLYDMLNQKYTVVQGRQHCRIALGASANPMCFVHDMFRCVVVMSVKDAMDADRPFLNRFEKHRLDHTDFLTQEQIDITRRLKRWVSQLAAPNDDAVPQDWPFDERSLLVGHSMDDNHAKLDQIRNYVVETALLQQVDVTEAELIDGVDVLEAACRRRLLNLFTVDGVLRVPLSRNAQLDPQMARWVQDVYFHEQGHNGLEDFLSRRRSSDAVAPSILGSRQVILTFSPIVGIAFEHTLGPHFGAATVLRLGAIKSENELTQQLQRFVTDARTNVFVLQADARLEQSYLPHAMFLTEEYLRACPGKHVLVIVHILRDVYEGAEELRLTLLSGWEYVTLDQLTHSSANDAATLVSVGQCRGKSVWELLFSNPPLPAFDDIFNSAIERAVLSLAYPNSPAWQDRAQQLLTSLRRSPTAREQLQSIVRDQMGAANASDAQASIMRDRWLVDLARDEKQLVLHRNLSVCIRYALVDAVYVHAVDAIAAAERWAGFDCLIAGTDVVAQEYQRAMWSHCFRHHRQNLYTAADGHTQPGSVAASLAVDLSPNGRVLFTAFPFAPFWLTKLDGELRASLAALVDDPSEATEQADVDNEDASEQTRSIERHRRQHLTTLLHRSVAQNIFSPELWPVRANDAGDGDVQTLSQASLVQSVLQWHVDALLRRNHTATSLVPFGTPLLALVELVCRMALQFGADVDVDVDVGRVAVADLLVASLLNETAVQRLQQTLWQFFVAPALHTPADLPQHAQRLREFVDTVEDKTQFADLLTVRIVDLLIRHIAVSAPRSVNDAQAARVTVVDTIARLNQLRPARNGAGETALLALKVLSDVLLWWIGVVPHARLNVFTALCKEIADRLAEPEGLFDHIIAAVEASSRARDPALEQLHRQLSSSFIQRMMYRPRMPIDTGLRFIASISARTPRTAATDFHPFVWPVRLFVEEHLPAFDSLVAVILMADEDLDAALESFNDALKASVPGRNDHSAGLPDDSHLVIATVDAMIEVCQQTFEELHDEGAVLALLVQEEDAIARAIACIDGSTSESMEPLTLCAAAAICYVVFDALAMKVDDFGRLSGAETLLGRVSGALTPSAERPTATLEALSVHLVKHLARRFNIPSDQLATAARRFGAGLPVLERLRLQRVQEPSIGGNGQGALPGSRLRQTLNFQPLMTPDDAHAAHSTQLRDALSDWTSLNDDTNLRRLLHTVLDGMNAATLPLYRYTAEFFASLAVSGETVAPANAGAGAASAHPFRATLVTLREIAAPAVNNQGNAATRARVALLLRAVDAALTGSPSVVPLVTPAADLALQCMLWRYAISFSCVPAETSIFSLLFHQPHSAIGRYIPGQPKSAEAQQIIRVINSTGAAGSWQVTRYRCPSCQAPYYVHNCGARGHDGAGTLPIETRCTACGQTVAGGMSVRIDANPVTLQTVENAQGIAAAPGYVDDEPEMLAEDMDQRDPEHAERSRRNLERSWRGLSALQFRAIHQAVYASLLAGYWYSHRDDTRLCAFFGGQITADTAVQRCLAHLRSDWKVIGRVRQAQNASDDAALQLALSEAVLAATANIADGSCASDAGRVAVEQHLCRAVDAFVAGASLAQNVQAFIVSRSQSADQGTAMNAARLDLLEEIAERWRPIANESYRRKRLPRLLRLRPVRAKTIGEGLENLRRYLAVNAELARTHRFLALLLQEWDQLCSAAHLIPLLTFAGVVRTQLNNRMHREQRINFRFRDLWAAQDARSASMQQEYIAFEEAWNSFADRPDGQPEFQVTLDCRTTPLPRMHADQPASMALLMPSDESFYLCALTSMLAARQTAFVRQAYAIAAQQDLPALQYLDVQADRVEPPMRQIGQLQAQRDVINLSDAHDDVLGLLDYSFANLGGGGMREYMLPVIETEIAQLALGHKGAIAAAAADFPSFMFRGETFRQHSLLQEVAKLVPQTLLPVERIQRIVADLARQDQLGRDLLDSLGNLLLTVARHRPQSTTALSAVAAARLSAYDQQQLRAIAELEQLTVTSVVQVFEGAEQALGGRVIEILPSDYREELPPQLRDNFVQTLTRHDPLDKHATALLLALKRLAFRHLLNRNIPRKNDPMRPYLEDELLWTSVGGEDGTPYLDWNDEHLSLSILLTHTRSLYDLVNGHLRSKRAASESTGIRVGGSFGGTAGPGFRSSASNASAEAGTVQPRRRDRRRDM